MNILFILNDPPYGTERDLKDSENIEGAKRSTMKELTQHTIDADKVLVF